METADHGAFRPARIHVIATPVPHVRLLRTVESRLRAMYDDLVNEPIPTRMADLVRRHEAATQRGGRHDG